MPGDLVGAATDIERIRVGENVRVPARRGEQQQHQRPVPGGHVPDLHAVARDPGGHLDGRVVAQCLFNRPRRHRRIVLQQSELAGMPQQRQDRVGDQADGGLMPGHQQQDAGGDQLVLGQLLAGVLGADHLRQQVLCRLCAPQGNQLAEVAGELVAGNLRGRSPRLRLRSVNAESGLQRVGQPGRPPGEPRVVLDRDAEHLRDDPHRQRIGKLTHDLKLPGSRGCSKQLAGDGPDPRFKPRDRPRRECLGHEPPEPGVIGRIKRQERRPLPSAPRRPAGATRDLSRWLLALGSRSTAEQSACLPTTTMAPSKSANGEAARRPASTG